jgi:hypothetical protein
VVSRQLFPRESSLVAAASEVVDDVLCRVQQNVCLFTGLFSSLCFFFLF